MGAEEEVEQEGNRVDESKSTVTQAQFLSWKQQKDVDASARNIETERKRAEDIAAGLVQMNGRELFEHEPWVFDNATY